MYMLVSKSSQLLTLFLYVQEISFHDKRDRKRNVVEQPTTSYSCCVLSSVDGIAGEMHLDLWKVNADSSFEYRPLRINIDSETGIVSGYFFNFHDHKPTFKVDSKDQPRVSLTGGPLNSTYLIDQFHFHVYCTRVEAEQNTLDKAHVPGEVSKRECSVGFWVLIKVAGNMLWLNASCLYHTND